MEYRYRTDDEMKDSGVEWIGKIPRDWEIIQLKRLISKTIDNRGKTPTYGTEGIPMLEVRQITNGTKFPSEVFEKFVSEDIAENFIRDNVKEGDVLISTVGATSGRAVIVGQNPRYFIAQNVIGFRFNKKVCKNFIYYAIVSNYFKSSLKMINKSNIIDNLKVSVFTSNNCVITNIKEQERIGDFLDKKTSQFDLIISKKEALIQRLEEAKKSLISEVVTGKVKIVKTDDGYELVKRSSDEMKDSGVEWLGERPKDWEVKKLRFLGRLQNGISKGSDQFGFGYPFVSYSNVYRNIKLPENIEGLVNSTDEERKIYSVEDGDVFFTRTSETVEEIGFASTCMKTKVDATFAGFLIRFRPNSSKLYKGFSKYYFRCDLNRKYFVKEMNLVTRASLSQNLLNNLAVTLPSYEEQIDIYNTLELKIGGINLSIDKLKYQIQKLKEAKQSLISEAVTGKIEILD